MKKLLVVLLALTCMQSAFAYEAANIKIRISGALSDNSYFLCLQNVGCLSIKAGNNGKVYPILHPIEMSTIFITDIDNDFRVTPQGLPSSCNVTVDVNHSITITGHATPQKNGTVKIQNLRCSVS